MMLLYTFMHRPCTHGHHRGGGNNPLKTLSIRRSLWLVIRQHFTVGRDCMVSQVHESMREEYESRLKETEAQLTRSKRQIQQLETRSAFWQSGQFFSAQISTLVGNWA